MKTIDELAYELTQRLTEETYDPMYIGPGLRPDLVARWILSSYKPPFEWEETPPSDISDDLDARLKRNWLIKCCVFIAGKRIQYNSFETPEMRLRDSEATKERHRDHIRKRLGMAIADFLDGKADE